PDPGLIVVTVVVGGTAVLVATGQLVSCLRASRDWGTSVVRGTMRMCSRPRVVTVTGVAPAQGPTVGGTRVTVTGTNFDNGAAVTFAGMAGANVVWQDAQTLLADVPAGQGAANVTVTNPDASTGTGLGLYTYMAPAVLQIQPVQGP